MAKRLVIHTNEVAPTVSKGLRRDSAELLFPEQLHKLAVAQHEAFREALCQMGAVVNHHNIVDEDCHDIHFTEDLVTIIPDSRDGRSIALLHRVGAPERRKEVNCIERFARGWVDEVIDLRMMGDTSTTLDGGDLKIVGNVILAGYGTSNGRAARTTLSGIKQLSELVQPMGYVVVPIAHRSLHFTTECGFFGPSPRDGRPVVTVTPAMLDIDLDALRQLRVFGEPVDIVTLPETELMSGNGLGFSGQAIVQKGFPTVAEQLHRRGFNVQAVDFSAFQQVDGGPSCLCVLCDNPMTLL